MAKGHVALKNSSAMLWILLLFLEYSHARKSETYYMQDGDCDHTKIVGGAVVYSHRKRNLQNVFYDHNIECRITFVAEQKDLKIMIKVNELDIPDRSYGALCNDALYVYDSETVMKSPMEHAGGNGGLCGNKLPSVLYSTGPYLTVYFRTDSGGQRGRGFSLTVTTFNQDYDKYESCGSRFRCDNNLCIDQDLICDRIDHCGDSSDELILGNSQCGKSDDGFIDKFLQLGITAAISITVGSVVIFVVCIVCIICCCCRCFRKKSQDNLHSSSGTTAATATSVTINNGGPPMTYHHQAPSWHMASPYRASYEDLRAYSHAGSSVYSFRMNNMNNQQQRKYGLHYDYTSPTSFNNQQPNQMAGSHMANHHGQPQQSHPVAMGNHHNMSMPPPSIGSHGSMVSPPMPAQGMMGQHVGQTPYMNSQGYYPMQPVQYPPGAGPTSITYSPYPQHHPIPPVLPPGRESYSQNSGYSSQAPPSYHRSHTPSSSRSNRSVKSNRSTESGVKYIQEQEKMAFLPQNNVNL